MIVFRLPRIDSEFIIPALCEPVCRRHYENFLALMLQALDQLRTNSAGVAEDQPARL